MSKYIAKYSLVKQLEDLKDGANIHNINSLLNLYYVRIRQYNRKMEDCDIEYVQETEEQIRVYIRENSK